MSQDDQNQKPLTITESPNPAESSDGPDSPISSHMPQMSSPVRSRALSTRTPRRSGLQSIHPYTTPLTLSNVDACVALEDAAFEEHERCSREKFEYRLTKCGELSIGLFSSMRPNSDSKAETLKVARVVETSRIGGEVGVLLAHIVSTRSFGAVVSDDAMGFPQDWRTEKLDESSRGHQEHGKTICLHSLAVVPAFQGKGLGRILLRTYIQQMSTAGIADRIALIAHEHLIEFYEGFGFVNKGRSKAEFGGGGWWDMVLEIQSLDARTAYG